MKVIDTKTIIINLLKEDKKTYLSVSRLQKLIAYIYDYLVEKCKLSKYITYFDVNFDAIERTVLYNNNIFLLDIDGDMIYLRENISMEELATEYNIDDDIDSIINNFIEEYAA